jgi:hypothetical protein
LDRAVAKEHRRDLYSGHSPEARQVPDVTGPDGVRVTQRVEPAVDRLLQYRLMFFTPPVLSDPAGAYFEYRVLPRLVQKYVLRDRWTVVVEADNGEKCRVKASSRQDAVDYARLIQDGIAKQGVGFLKTFAS